MLPINAPTTPPNVSPNAKSITAPLAPLWIPTSVFYAKMAFSSSKMLLVPKASARMTFTAWTALPIASNAKQGLCWWRGRMCAKHVRPFIASSVWLAASTSAWLALSALLSFRIPANAKRNANQIFTHFKTGVSSALRVAPYAIASSVEGATRTFTGTITPKIANPVFLTVSNATK